MDERVLLAARARREDAAIARGRERLQDGEQLLLRLARRIDHLRESLPELPAVIHARETKIFIGCLGERRDGLDINTQIIYQGIDLARQQTVAICSRLNSQHRQVDRRTASHNDLLGFSLKLNAAGRLNAGTGRDN